jgi:hypothetical protein
MSFKFRTLDTTDQMTYFAFTYPYTYRELQASLDRLTRRYGNGGRSYEQLRSLPVTGIYFHREIAVRSLEHRRMDLLTITGLNGITHQREIRLRKSDQLLPVYFFLYECKIFSLLVRIETNLFKKFPQHVFP